MRSQQPAFAVNCGDLWCHGVLWCSARLKTSNLVQKNAPEDGNLYPIWDRCAVLAAAVASNSHPTSNPNSSHRRDLGVTWIAGHAGAKLCVTVQLEEMGIYERNLPQTHMKT